MKRLRLNNVSAYWHQGRTLSGYGRERGVSLEAGPGEWIAVIGDNGIGKSTLFHAVAGTANFVEGRVFVDDIVLPPRQPTARFLAGVQHVEQKPAFSAPSLPVSDAITIAKRARPAFFNERAISDLIRRLRTEGWMQSEMLTPRLFDLAVAILAVPSVLLLDEIHLELPTAAQPGRLYALIRECLPMTTVLFIDHDRNRARASADRILWLREDEMPSLFHAKAKSHDLDDMLVTRSGPASALSPGEEAAWLNAIRLDRSPANQIALALLAGGYRGSQGAQLQQQIETDFGFLAESDIAEGLSGGQRVILLWFIAKLSGVAGFPEGLFASLDGRRRSMITKWEKQLDEVDSV